MKQETVMEILKEHGPLSTRGIMLVAYPDIRDHEVISRRNQTARAVRALYRWGFIEECGVEEYPRRKIIWGLSR